MTRHAADKYRPIRNRILVKPDPPAEKIGAIYIPESARHDPKEQLRIGTVIKMGPGMPMHNGERWPMPDVKTGQKIFYSIAGATPIMFTDYNGNEVEHHIIIDESVRAAIDG